jgi:hypothetical protein
MPIILAPGKLRQEVSSMRPVWAIQQDSVSKKEDSHRIRESIFKSYV